MDSCLCLERIKAASKNVRLSEAQSCPPTLKSAVPHNITTAHKKKSPSDKKHAKKHKQDQNKEEVQAIRLWKSLGPTGYALRDHQLKTFCSPTTASLGLDAEEVLEAQSTAYEGKSRRNASEPPIPALSLQEYKQRGYTIEVWDGRWVPFA